MEEVVEEVDAKTGEGLDVILLATSRPGQSLKVARRGKHSSKEP